MPFPPQARYDLLVPMADHLHISRLRLQMSEISVTVFCNLLKTDRHCQLHYICPNSN